jgi:flagellin
MDISTQLGANQTIEAFDSAVSRVSQVRGNFGAIQNRLEHTISNLIVSEENLTAAEYVFVMLILQKR